MDHATFLAHQKDPTFHWGVRGFYRAVHALWGAAGLWTVIAQTAAILTPALLLAGYAASTGPTSLLVWPVFALFAFRAGNPSPSGVGAFFSLLCVIAGLVLAFSVDALHVWGSLLPGLTWFAASALKGTTLMSLEERIFTSEDAYQRLRDSGELMLPEQTRDVKSEI